MTSLNWKRVEDLPEMPDDKKMVIGAHKVNDGWGTCFVPAKWLSPWGYDFYMEIPEGKDQPWKMDDPTGLAVAMCQNPGGSVYYHLYIPEQEFWEAVKFYNTVLGVIELPDIPEQ